MCKHNGKRGRCKTICPRDGQANGTDVFTAYTEALKNYKIAEKVLENARTELNAASRIKSEYEYQQRKKAAEDRQKKANAGQDYWYYDFEDIFKQKPGTKKDLPILNLKWPYTADDIKKAYRAAAFKYHPDRGGSDAMMAQVNVARDTGLKYVN